VVRPAFPLWAASVSGMAKQKIRLLPPTGFLERNLAVGEKFVEEGDWNTAAKAALTVKPVVVH
jgi:hypothetical protein